MSSIKRTAAVGLVAAIIAASFGACAHGRAEIDVVDIHGYSHHGYYDDHRDWHGGYYDADRHFHDDPRDWHDHRD